MKNLIRAKFKSILLACFAALMVVCALLGGITLQTQSASAMNAASGTVSVYSGGDIYNTTKGKFDKKAVQDLLVKLGKGAGATADTKSYKALETAYSAPVTSATLNSKNGGDLVVTFGGMTWTVTYLSTDNDGDLIATLWYTGNDVSSTFSGSWRSGTTSGGYSGYTKHSNHYGGSYIRAITLGNGGQYYTASGTTVSADSSVSTVTATAAQAQASKFYEFAQGAISEYLVAPNNVSWQQLQYNSAFSAYRTQNDNLVSTTANWYSTNIQNSQNDPLYYQWGADKIWLPSIPEVGWSTSQTGIWGTSTNQRQSASSTSYDWLRSGAYSYAYSAYVLYTSGAYNYAYTHGTYGVRPALHLNLKSAAKAAGVSVPTVTEGTKTYTGLAIDSIENIEADNVTIAVTRDTNVVSAPDFATDSAKGVLSATKAGDYEATFTLKNTYPYSDVTYSADEEAWVHKSLTDDDGNPLVVPVWDPDGIDLKGNDVTTDAAYEILIAPYSVSFTIKKRAITVKWTGEGGSTTDFAWAYTGTANQPAYALTGEQNGEKVVLSVDYQNTKDLSWVTTAFINSGDYKIRLKLSNDSVNANYTLNDGSNDVTELTQAYKIEPTYLTVKWFGESDSTSDFSWVYNNTAYHPTAKVYMPSGSEATDAVISYTYALQSGKTGTLETDGGAPIHAGDYVATVVFTSDNANLNYGFATTTTTTQNFSITPLSASDLTWSQASSYTYNNKAQAPTATAHELGGAELTLTYTYQLKQSNGTWGTATSTTPKNAGTYLVTAKEQNNDYTLPSANNTTQYTIDQCAVTVTWDWTGFDATHHIAYNSLAQAPTATATASNIWNDTGDSVGNHTLTLTKTILLGSTTLAGGAINANTSAYTAKVTLSGDEATNYKLSDDNVAFYIDKRVITADEIQWYNNTDLLNASKVEFVFGTMPNISAKAVITVNGTEKTFTLVTVGNGYNPYYDPNSVPVWPMQDYTFTVALDSADASNFTVAAEDLVLHFSIVAARVQADEMSVVWVISVGGSYQIINSGYQFTYNGSVQKPIALGYFLKDQSDPSTAFDINNSQTYYVLNLVGADYKDAGLYTAYARPNQSNADISFYVEDGTDEFEYEILPLQVEVEWVVATNGYTYNGSAQGPSIQVNSTLSTLLSAEFNKLLTVGKATNAGTYTINATAGDNYELYLSGETAEKSLSYTFTINQLELSSIIVWDVTTFVYDGDTKTPTFKPITTYDLDITVAGGQTNAGTYAAIAQLTNAEKNRNYKLNITNATTVFVIKQAELTAVWTDGDTDTFTWTYDGTSRVPSASVADFTLADGTSVTFTIGVTGAETNAGSYSATAAITRTNVAGLALANFVITNPEQAFTIDKAALTVTADDKSVTYGAAVPKYTATASGSIASTDSATALVSGVQFRCAYGQYSAASTTGYKIEAYGLDLQNYDVTYVDGKLTVKALSVTATIVDLNGTYGEHFREPSIVATGILNGDSLGITFEFYSVADDGTETLITDPSTKIPVAGTYIIRANTTKANANYDFGTIADGTYTVAKKALVVTADSTRIQYGDPVPTYTVSVAGLVGNDAAPAFVATSTYDPSDASNNIVGNYTITVTPLTMDNYEVAAADYKTGTLQVVARLITVQINSVTVQYGDSAADLTAAGSWTVDASALVNGDTESDLGVTLTKATNGLNGSTAVTGNAVGVYDINGSSTNTNYSIEFKVGTYKITKATLTVTVNNLDGTNAITYGTDATTVAGKFSVTYSGFKNGDTATSSGVWVSGKGTVSYNCPYTAGSNVGNYTISAYGLEAVNYDIEYKTGTLEIKAKDITLSIDNASSVYGMPQANLTYTVVNPTDLYGNDNLGVTLTKDDNGTISSTDTTPVTGMNVGRYEITGTASNVNYNVKWQGKAYYTVTRATLTVKANDNTITYGDDNTSDSWANGYTVSGLVAGDDDTVLTGTVAYAYDYSLYGNVGNGYTITPSGLDAENYTVNFESGVLTVVPKAITVTIDDKESMYGKDEVALTTNAASVVLRPEDDLNITLERGRNTVKDAGAYSITCKSYNNPNYTVTFVNGTYTIKPYEIEIVWTSGNAADPTNFTYTYNGDEQKPVASYESFDGSTQTLTVSGGRTRAGEGFTAEAVLPTPTSNFVFKTGTSATQLFTISPKTITISWYNERTGSGTDDDPYDYSTLIAANGKATFKYNGVLQFPYAVASGLCKDDTINIEVIGKAIQVGTYTAEAVISDTVGNGNYLIATASKTCLFEITALSALGFAWYESADSTTSVTSGTLAYTYDGYAHQPWIKSGIDDKYSYTITFADGTSCGNVALNVGKYKVVATPADPNLSITTSESTFLFEIKAATVTVVWTPDDGNGATSFEYNGSAQIPTAYFVDPFGYHYSLVVTVSDGKDSTAAGTYEASVSLPTTGNYAFAGTTAGSLVYTATRSYTITEKKIEVVWTSKIDGGKWIMEYNGAEVDASSIFATASMLNAVDGESVSLVHTILLDGKPVTQIKNAGTYTIKVELATANANYKIVDAEKTFEITKPALEIKASSYSVNYGDPTPALTATFDGFVTDDSGAQIEDENSLGLVEDGVYFWLFTEYNQNSSPRDEGYDVILVTAAIDPAAYAKFNEILKNYDVTFIKGLIEVIAGQGDVKFIGTFNSGSDMIYNGHAQLPTAYYKSSKASGEWIPLDVTLYTDDTYTTESTDGAIDVNTYYIKVSKRAGDADDTELTKVEWTFKIVKLEVQVDISDNELTYGDVKENNYANRLNYNYFTVVSLNYICAYDEDLIAELTAKLESNLLEIALNVDLTFDAEGYVNAGSYRIYGTWSEDAALRNNYSVKFVGTQEAEDGTNSEGLFSVALAKISVVTDGDVSQTSYITGDPIYVELGAANTNPNTINEYKYAYIRVAGMYEADAHISYVRYNLDSYSLDEINSPERDEELGNFSVDNPAFNQNVSRWLVNYKIEVANHETYYGQWIIYILPDSNHIVINFVKNYEIEYGEEAATGKELTEILLDGGYIEIDRVLSAEDFIKYASASVSYNKNLSLADAGEYTVEFTFDSIPGSTVEYVASYKNNTNVNAYVVVPRLLEVDWGTTEFKYDGTVKLSSVTPTLNGWINGGSLELDGLEVASVKNYTFSDDGADISVTVITEEQYDFRNNGGHQIAVQVNDSNYTIDIANAAGTVSISLDDNGFTSNIAPWLMWLLIALAIALAIGLIIFIIIAVARRKATNDDDGFYETPDIEQLEQMPEQTDTV